MYKFGAVLKKTKYEKFRADFTNLSVRDIRWFMIWKRKTHRVVLNNTMPTIDGWASWCKKHDVDIHSTYEGKRKFISYNFSCIFFFIHLRLSGATRLHFLLVTHFFPSYGQFVDIMPIKRFPFSRELFMKSFYSHTTKQNIAYQFRGPSKQTSLNRKE